MGQLIPDGFLTIRDAAEKVAAAMYAGVPDRSSVTQFREQGFDVADGAAIDDGTWPWHPPASPPVDTIYVGDERP